MGHSEVGAVGPRCRMSVVNASAGLFLKLFWIPFKESEWIFLMALRSSVRGAQCFVKSLSAQDERKLKCPYY